MTESSHAHPEPTSTRPTYSACPMQIGIAFGVVLMILGAAKVGIAVLVFSAIAFPFFSGRRRYQHGHFNERWERRANRIEKRAARLRGKFSNLDTKSRQAQLFYSFVLGVGAALLGVWFLTP